MKTSKSVSRQAKKRIQFSRRLLLLAAAPLSAAGILLGKKIRPRAEPSPIRWIGHI
jgi:hypothetical protein